MSYQIVSIKTSLEKAKTALTENDKKNNIQVIPPLQAIFFNREHQIAMPEEVQEEDISGDITFVMIPDSVDINDVDILEFFEVSPIKMLDNKEEVNEDNVDDKENSEIDSIESLFGNLEKEIEQDTVEKDFLRISDIYSRMNSSPEDTPTVVESDNGVLGKIIPEGYSQHYILFNETEIVYDNQGLPSSLNYDVTSSPSYLCVVKRIELEGGEISDEPVQISLDQEGSLFFVGSTASLFGIESFLPGTITVVSANIPVEEEENEEGAELDISISSWKVRYNHFEPLSPVQSNEILSLNRKYLLEEIREEEENNQDDVHEIYKELLEELAGQLDMFVNYGRFEFRDTIESIDTPLVRSVFGYDSEELTQEVVQALLQIEDMNDDD